jgi:iron complex transport system substrate-binding protein
MELRLLPLISSATEIVHALGLGRFQVGRSHECDYPPEVSQLPVCTRPNIPVTGSSAEIDRLVKERAAAAASIYEVDTNLIRELQPTHIFTQTQCKVCAVSLDDVERAMCADIGTNIRVVALEPYALADLWRDIRKVAEACGCVAGGENIVHLLQQRMAAIAARAAQSATRPRVAALEWIDPLMAAGNWVPELIEMAGGENLFGVAGEHSPWMTWEQVSEADPDIVVALPCGFNLERSVGDARLLSRLPGWTNLKAVRAASVYACDGNQYLNRPGPRLLESLEIIAEILHPEIFEPKFESTGWLRVM